MVAGRKDVNKALQKMEKWSLSKIPSTKPKYYGSGIITNKLDILNPFWCLSSPIFINCTLENTNGGAEYFGDSIVEKKIKFNIDWGIVIIYMGIKSEDTDNGLSWRHIEGIVEKKFKVDLILQALTIDP